jgi:3-oxoadipate enol-lactonase
MPTITIHPNLTINYLDPNPGGTHAVLLLHGLGATGESWTLQITVLIESGFRVLAPDIRGFGKSTCPAEAITIQKIASDMAEFLKRLKALPAHVVGISMGGTIAQQISLDYPYLVEKLVLVNTFANLRPKRLSSWAYFGSRFFLIHTLGLPSQARLVTRKLFPDQDQGDLRKAFYDQIIQANPRGYRSTIRALAHFNLTSRLPEIRAPTLVITGERDSTVPSETQKELTNGIPNAKQVIILGAGHAVIAEQPGIFNRILLDFLQTQ